MISFGEFSQLLTEKLITFGGKAYPKFGNIVIMAGGAGCYPAGTEYFNGTGWSKIEEYDGGEVLVFDTETNSAFMSKPLSFVDKEADQFYEIRNGSVSFATSEQHKHLLIDDAGEYFTKTTLELVNDGVEGASLVVYEGQEIKPLQLDSAVITKVESGDRMYCFETVTGFFVVRQNGQIFVSGNSGKGFILKNLIGMEGTVLDPDALKQMAQITPKIIDLVKKQYGKDISKEVFSMKTGENVAFLHHAISDLGIQDKHKQNLFTSISGADESRKPNLIFDVTMKDMKRFDDIIRDAQTLGYKPENIHVVWVVNDVELAKAQNQKRDRTVPEDILMQTHIGAQQTMFDLLKDTVRLGGHMNGDVVLAFNKANVDATLVKSSSGGMYIKDANYIYVKRKGKKPLSPDELGKEWLNKIASYTPGSKDWKDLLDNLNTPEKT